MENIIEISNLNFAFDAKRPILKNINLEVPKGAIFGFLGANGAGKSTTMRVIMGLHSAPKNAVKVFGASVDTIYPSAFSKIGALIDYPAFYDHLSGYDNLKVIAILKEISASKIDEILEIVGLTNARNVKMKRYSLGMKQRLAIGLALIGEPELLVLDEPVNGLDPNGMLEIRELLIKLNKEKGITIFISSHLLQEIDKMVTHLAIISHGEIKFQGSKNDLISMYKFQKTKFELLNAAHFKSLIPSKYSTEIISETEMIIDTQSKDEIAQITTLLVENDAKISQIASAGGLEEWFLDITKSNKIQ